jgi:hypothetical protein
MEVDEQDDPWSFSLTLPHWPRAGERALEREMRKLEHEEMAEKPVSEGDLEGELADAWA